jgi:hypothetical protein
MRVLTFCDPSRTSPHTQHVARLVSGRLRCLRLNHGVCMQIQAEYLIMSNLDAAMRDVPKPAMFKPTAGTGICMAYGVVQGWEHGFCPLCAAVVLQTMAGLACAFR